MTDRAADHLRDLRRSNPGYMMRGWEVFHAVSPEREGSPISRPLPGDEDHPEGELTEGIAAVQLSVYGDEPEGAYLHVVGVDRESTEAAFARANASVLAGIGLSWYGRPEALIQAANLRAVCEAAEAHDGFRSGAVEAVLELADLLAGEG